MVENFKGIAEKIHKDKIVAVSKNHGREKILPLLEYGHRIFGENRVQEALGKWPELKAEYPGVELHLIGPLQSNKVKDALGIFDVIETVDREKIAIALSREEKKIDLLIQVNTGEEPQKAGIIPREADGFIKFCIHDLGLGIKGLMCIPPLDDPPALHFGLLRKISMRNSLKTLSMGMSGDFETAAAMGATHLRIGTAIFGERNVPA